MSAAHVRVGSGFDAHRLARGRPLMLGCVQVPFESGLLGHSDGDCLAHAVCDALLGAAALGDMGQHFPSSESRWRGVASRVFVDHTLALVRAQGYAIVNVDATVIAQVPPLAPHLPAMRQALAEALEVPVGRVSVKAKSTDALGAVGRKEGIAALATVLLEGAGPENA
jgi:2-C-methyl-D-erythritol 2,4-cyclodiphosphate synthase